MWIVRTEQDCPSFTCYHVTNTENTPTTLIVTDRWKIRVVEGVISDEIFKQALFEVGWKAKDGVFPNYACFMPNIDLSVDVNMDHLHRRVVNRAIDIVYFNHSDSWIEVD